MSSVNQEALQAAADAAEEAHSPPNDSLTLSNGIVLKVKPVPLFLVQSAVTKLEKPRVPIVDIAEKGRKEPNPDDPAYLEALERYEALTIEAALDIGLVAGIEVVSIPEGVYGENDDGWLAPLEFLGMEVDQRPNGRRLSWLRYYAIASADDLANVSVVILRNLGLSEEEVGKAAESLPSGTVRGADNGASVEDAGHGDNVRAPSTRRGARSRGTRSG